MNKKLIKILAIVLGAVLCVALAAGIAVKKTQPFREPTTYPYVFVHGLNGYGTDIVSSDRAPYWGSTAGDLLHELEYRGYTCVAPSGGASASAWDRACELYAALTGTTVDYGEAHSQEFGHERFGNENPIPLLPDWGKTDDQGNVQKINLVGHSFGGASARMLTELLAYGSEQERHWTPEDCSPLFMGGQEDMVFSVTALTAPHNGTTLLELTSVGIVQSSVGLLDKLLQSPLGQLAQGALGLFGIDLNEPLAGQSSLSDMLKMAQTRDNAYYDLTLHGAWSLNNHIRTLPNIYYFSHPADGTQEGKNGTRVPVEEEMFAPLRVSAGIMGSFNFKDVTFGGTPLDHTWLPNDGLVPTVSMLAPSDALKENFSRFEVEQNVSEWEENAGFFSRFNAAPYADNIQRGVWNVYSTMRGDHAKPVGLNQEKSWLVEFYLEQMELIDHLSREETKGWAYSVLKDKD
ncbi:MAG: hypothetical protein FWG82_01240 [Oscillospiraceae bacterium]|nr:hypothetical protein [Oscillospiraceae bacterium]